MGTLSLPSYIIFFYIIVLYIAQGWFVIEKLPLADEVLHGLSENLKQLPFYIIVSYIAQGWLVIEKLPLADEVLHGLSENLKQLPLRLRIQCNLQLSIYSAYHTRTVYKNYSLWMYITFNLGTKSDSYFTPVWKIIEINPIEKPIFENKSPSSTLIFFFHNHSWSPI